jgi:hypothetical protein
MMIIVYNLSFISRKSLESIHNLKYLIEKITLTFDKLPFFYL